MSGCAVNQFQDVSLTNHEKDIALLAAAYEGNIQEAKRQLASGANVNAKDKDYRNETSLQYAAQEGHSKIAELLIANGGNVNAKVFGNGETPLQFAVQGSHEGAKESLQTSGPVTLGSLRGHFGATLEPLWVYGGDFSSLWDHYGMIVESLWVYEGPFSKNAHFPHRF